MFGKNLINARRICVLNLFIVGLKRINFSMNKHYRVKKKISFILGHKTTTLSVRWIVTINLRWEFRLSKLCLLVRTLMMLIHRDNESCQDSWQNSTICNHLGMGIPYYYRSLSLVNQGHGNNVSIWVKCQDLGRLQKHRVTQNRFFNGKRFQTKDIIQRRNTLGIWVWWTYERKKSYRHRHKA